MNKLKIGIYDKWLNALGGGEKVATVMAETLSKKGYDVSLISNSDISIEEVESKMGTDLSKVKFVFWAERSYDKLSKLTKKYDIFINVSFLDHLPSLAKKSYYYVHFPTVVRNNLFGFIKYETLLPFLRKFFITPEFVKGLEHIDEINVRGGKWLKNENTLVLANPPSVFNMKFRFYSEELTLGALKSVKFSSPNAKIELIDKYIDHRSNVLVYKLSVKLKTNDSLIINIKPNQGNANYSIGLVSMTVNNIRYFLWNMMKRYMPTYEMALYGSSTYRPALGLSSYDKFIANSNFTKYWIKKYWDKESTVIYPPIETKKFKPGKKRNMILNVGRFFVGGHSKRQDVLVEVFKSMVDNKELSSEWELHLVGGVASGIEHQNYLAKIMERAKNYPIYFHISADFSELKKLYSQAKIYWHATGYGKHLNKEPIALEHFGITVVEAMSAGCIPIVFNAGGLKEPVNNNKNYLWNDMNELQKKTLDVINSKSLRKKSKQFIERADDFSIDRFSKEILELIRVQLK